MSIDSMIHSAEKADKEAGECWRRNNHRQGADDARTFIAEKKRVEVLWINWMPINWMDAVGQADETAAQKLSDKHLAEYIMDTWGWSMDEYHKFVSDENQKQREHWIKMDFNGKIKRGLV